MFKKFFGFLIVVVVAVLLWFGFALWTGIYSVYSVPPSRQEPDGSTLIVSRDEGEPMFNSPDYTPPPRKKTTTGGIGFESLAKPRRPVDGRTIVKLPFIDWAYRKSLEKPEAAK